jgi:hypothetical protein
MYYLEDLNLQDINFLNQLLENYRKSKSVFEDNKPIPLPPVYHIFREKVKRLVKYVSYNPNETDTPKKPSKYSEFKKQIRKKTYRMKKQNIKETKQ